MIPDRLQFFNEGVCVCVCVFVCVCVRMFMQNTGTVPLDRWQIRREGEQEDERMGDCKREQEK